MKIVLAVFALAFIVGLQSCGIDPPEAAVEAGDEEISDNGDGNGEAGGSGDGYITTKIAFQAGNYPLTKSESPDEDLISDANIFIFNSVGLMEEKIYVKASGLTVDDDGDYCYATKLLQGCTYSIYVCTNIGFKMSCSTLDELLSYRFYLAYPDDYKIGVPMSGVRKSYKYKGEEEIVVPLHRTMAKVSVAIDRSEMNDDVEFYVNRITVGNCPKSVNMFIDSSVEGSSDVYTLGFNRKDGAVGNLNTSVSGQVSGEVSLYMFENMQGSPLGEIGSFAEKVFEDGDAAMDRCSYIEIEASYVSDTYYSLPGESLIYRFYLGESPSDFNVKRNCHYHITVRPEGNGLAGSGWRVDKSGLGYRGTTSIAVNPGTIVTGNIGDEIHVYCEIEPEDAPFAIGMEELEEDKATGIYDYVIDDDGMGVTLTLTKSGTGILYFEAGWPIDDAAAVLIVVNLPTS